MKKEKWAFKRFSGNTYFNGTAEWVWGDNPNAEVDFPSIIKSKFIFASEKEALESDVYLNDPLLRSRFFICNVTNIQYKPISTYTPYLPNKPILAVGRKNEHCSQCGQNIIAGEEYVRWTDKKVICLHCIMSHHDTYLGLYKNIPKRYKMEWNANGRPQFNEIVKDFL